MRTLGIHHVAIQVHDVEKVAAFYRDVLALPERARHHRDDGSLRSIWIETSADGSFLAIEELRPGIRGTLGHSLVALRIARRATDPFAILVTFGILALFFTHVFENVGMTVNLMPITGIPLPFFSYGGSFLISCCVAIGISLRVAWESRQSGYVDVSQ